jgi:L,D-transpeptidase catalytic domain
MAIRLPDFPADWPRRATLVALVALFCGCSSVPPPRDAPREAPPAPAPPAPPPIAPDDGPTAEAIARTNPQISPAVARAIAHVLRQPSDHPRAAVLDFSAPSGMPRFHLVERASGRVFQTFRVAHGQGSEGSRRDGRAEVFSNVPDTNASSLGLYRTAETYMSEVYPGLAMRMDGLSPTNSNARSRFIVIHAARYMEPESWKGKKGGRPGLSDGCFVFSKADRDVVISSLHGGALIYAIYEKP